MPRFCAVYGCSNRSNREKDKKFFGFPGIRDRRGRELQEGKARRMLWLKAIHRDDLTEEKLRNASVCSDHFITGYPAPEGKMNHPDYVPNQNLGYVSSSSVKSGAVDQYKRTTKRLCTSSPKIAMENDIQMLTVEETMKIEVEEVKLEPAEMDSGSFGVEQITWGSAIKDDNGNIYKIGLNRIENEHNYAKAWIKCNVSSEEFVEMEDKMIKVEKDLGCVKFEVNEITEEEFIIKNENDVYESSIDANTDLIRRSSECAEVENGGNFTLTTMTYKSKKLVGQIERMHLEMFMDIKNYLDIDTSQSQIQFSASKPKIPRRRHHKVCKKDRTKSFTCYNCDYTTCHKYRLTEHMKEHRNRKSTHSYSPKLVHCNATFKRNAYLDNHPDSEESVSSKMLESEQCTYKSTEKDNSAKHTLRQPDTTCGYKPRKCMYCDATYKNKRNLNEHTIRKHPDFIASISSKIYECTYCKYRAAVKITLDEHTIRSHPDFIESVSSKIHECTHCRYQTVIKPKLTIHMLRHPETTFSYKFRKCMHCNATFRGKRNLDEHTIRNHPDFIASVSSKIYECTHCTYKTFIKPKFARHMLKHPETAFSYKYSVCNQCDATFISKQDLDEHTVKKHPDCMASVSGKIHECPHCTFKTTVKTHIDIHVLKHHKTVVESELNRCDHCDRTFNYKRNLEKHIVRKHPDLIASVSNT